MRHNFHKLLSLYCAFVLVATAVLLSQYYIDKLTDHHVITEDLKYLPSGKFLKGAALSYDEIAADLLWVKAIGYFGKHARTDQDYTWLYHIIDITTTLDPLASDPYEFGGIVLGTELGEIDKSIAILKKGMKNVPKHHKRYWYLPFFTAFNYMYYKGDYQTAAKYLEQAASFPQSPTYLPLLVARLYANTNAPGVAIPFLQEMITQTNSPEIRARLQKRIKEVQIKQDINVLSAASEQFKKLTGRYPEHIKELLDSGIMKTLPTEPFGGQYQIMEDGAIKSTSNTASMELYINKNKNKKASAPLIFSKEPK